MCDGSLRERLDRVVDRAVGSGRIVGAVVLVSKDGTPAYSRAAGYLDREAKRPMRIDAIFRLASLTKPVVAATALALVDRRRLGLDDAVAQWLPDFRPRLRDRSAPDMLVRHLLTHTSGLAYTTLLPDDAYRRARISTGLDQPGLSLAENLRRLSSVPLCFPPGTGWRYSMSTDVLGAVIEKAHGGRLGDAVAELVTGPLGMHDTAFRVVDEARLAVPYADGRSGSERMNDPHIVPEDPASALAFSPSRILDPDSYQSGGAGMAGTAGDFMRFMEAIRTGGAPILEPGTAAIACRNQIGDLERDESEAGWRFGFLSGVMDDPIAAMSPHGVGTLEWGGVYGHRWFIDPAAGLSVASFTNTTMEGVKGTFPVEIRDAVYGRAAGQ